MNLMSELKRMQKAYTKLHKVDKGKALREIAKLCGLTTMSIGNRLNGKFNIKEDEFPHFRQVLKI